MKLVAISKFAVHEQNREKLVDFLEKDFFPYAKKFEGLQSISVSHNATEVLMLEYWDTLKNAKKLSEALSTEQEFARRAWSLSIGTLEREIYKLV